MPIKHCCISFTLTPGPATQDVPYKFMTHDLSDIIQSIVILVPEHWSHWQILSLTPSNIRLCQGLSTWIKSQPSVPKSHQHCPLFKLNGRNSTQHQRHQIGKLQLNCNKKLNWARIASKLQRTFNFVGPQLESNHIIVIYMYLTGQTYHYCFLDYESLTLKKFNLT